MRARSDSLERKMSLLQHAVRPTPRLAPASRPWLPRLLEILPTATVWLIITAPVWGAILAPAALGFGMMLFSVYWLWKSLNFACGVLIGFWRLHNAQQRNWIADCVNLAGYEQLRHL